MLTKPLGTQIAVNAHQWIEEVGTNRNWKPGHENPPDHVTGQSQEIFHSYCRPAGSFQTISPFNMFLQVRNMNKIKQM